MAALLVVHSSLHCFAVFMLAAGLGAAVLGGLGVAVVAGLGAAAGAAAAWPRHSCNEDLLGLPARLNRRLVGRPFVVALFGCFLLSCGRNRGESQHRCGEDQSNK